MKMETKNTRTNHNLIPKLNLVMGMNLENIMIIREKTMMMMMIKNLESLLVLVNEV